MTYLILNPAMFERLKNLPPRYQLVVLAIILTVVAYDIVRAVKRSRLTKATGIRRYYSWNPFPGNPKQ